MPNKRKYDDYLDICSYIRKAIKCCEEKNLSHNDAYRFLNNELNFYFKIFENITSYRRWDVHIMRPSDFVDIVIVMIKDNDFDAFPKSYFYFQKEK